jgi:hypothetical protein
MAETEQSNNGDASTSVANSFIEVRPARELMMCPARLASHHQLVLDDDTLRRPANAFAATAGTGPPRS